MKEAKIPEEDTICQECETEIVDANRIIDDFMNNYKNNLSAFVAFTWSPDPSKFPSFDPVTQYGSILFTLLKTNVMRRSIYPFLFVPEINENGNVHLHGIYSIKNNGNYYHQFIPYLKRYGFVKIKKNVDIKWFDYLRKDINKYTFGTMPRIITQFQYDDLRYSLIIEPKLLKVKMSLSKHASKRINKKITDYLK